MIQSITWFPAALISLMSFGLWGFFTKMAITYVDAKTALIYQALGIAMIGFLTLALISFKPESDIRGISFGLMSGIATGIGSLFYLVAADKGKVTTIVTMTALYPLITIFLAYIILHEGINLKQGAGILLALAAIYLLS
jgi:transporter family protein